MAAPKARDILRLVRDDDGNVQSVIIKDHDGSERTHYVDKLPRVELMRVVAQVWPGKRDWRRYGNDQIMAAITKGELPEVIEVAAGGNDPQTYTSAVSQPAWPIDPSQPITPVRQAEPVSEPVREQAEPVAQAEPVDSDPLAKALRQAMRSIAADTVNEQQVRNIVKNETQQLIAEAVGEISRPVITMIQVNSAEPIELPGRTHKAFERVVQAVGQRENLMMIGTPGVGKTHLAEQVAEALGLAYYSIQCHAQMPGSELFGFIDAGGTYRTTLFRQAFEFGGVFLADEVDNGNTNILASLNASLANGMCAFKDGMVKRHPDFVVLAAANTYGTGPDAMFAGRNALDSAFLDRFTRMSIDIDEELEAEIATAISPQHAADWLSTVRRYRERVATHGLKVFVTPRATFAGLKLLNAGWTKQEVIEARILAGLTPDQRTKLAG